MPFPISYGGFGTVLTKAALEHLSKPIYCPADQYVCNKIHEDLVGESSLFKNGMSIFEVFYKYSALNDFCMHSDWVLSYVLKHFLPQNDIASNNLVGIKSHPSCGNYTLSGSVRPCTSQAASCHDLTTNDMKVLTLKAFMSHHESFDPVAKTGRTELNVIDHASTTNEFRRAQVLVSYYNCHLSAHITIIYPHHIFIEQWHGTIPVRNQLHRQYQMSQLHQV